MRRSVMALALVTVTVATFGTAACGAPDSVGDGHIGGDWAVLDTPTVPVPAVGECRSGVGQLKVEWRMPLFSTAPVACGEKHLTETFHLGTLTGSSAALAAPPQLGDDGFRDAFEGCAAAAKSFLGDVWQKAAVAIVPVLPTARQWQGNARWYRCEMLRVSDAAEHVVAVIGSLSDGLRGAKPYALTCAKDSGKDESTVGAIVYSSCATPHTVELSGIYIAKDGEYPGLEQAANTALAACKRIGAGYLGQSVSDFANRSGVAWLAWGADEGRWAAGDRSFRCYVGTYDRKKLIKGSIKGLGGGSLPY